MEKIVTRLRYPKENRQVCRCFDHWVFWLKVRKSMKYYLRKCNMMVLPVKCDM